MVMKLHNFGHHSVTEFAVLHMCSMPLFRFLDSKLAVLSYILRISNKSAPKKNFIPVAQKSEVKFFFGALKSL